jgi:hypothetical protein
LLSFFSPVLLLSATPFTRPGIHQLSAALSVATIVTFGAYLLLLHRRVCAGRCRIEKILPVGFALGCSFLLAEAFAASWPASHAVGYTLSSRLWYRKYWSIADPRGYRDVDHDVEPGRRVYVLGDSFVAGVGLADVEQRFSNILHRRLAPEFRVYNLGRNGSDTRDEYRRLGEEVVAPDLLILFYYSNDIEEACMELGHKMPAFSPYSNVPRAVGYVVRRSYVLDLIYWRFPQRDLLGREDALRSCYLDRKVLEIQLEDLTRFVVYSHTHGTPLVVVAFPHLIDAETSRRLIDPVIQLFESKNVLLIDVYPLIARLDVSQRIVSWNDSHPSPLLNRELADSALAMLQSSGILNHDQQ